MSYSELQGAGMASVPGPVVPVVLALAWFSHSGRALHSRGTGCRSDHDIDALASALRGLGGGVVLL